MSSILILITVMEVAVGEYDIDLSKMMGTALKKYYEERDAHALGLVTSDNVIRHHNDGMYPSAHPFFYSNYLQHKSISSFAFQYARPVMMIDCSLRDRSAHCATFDMALCVSAGGSGGFAFFSSPS